MASGSETMFIDTLLDPFASALNPAAARAIAEFRADAATQAIVDELAEKANQDLLTEAERSQYEQLVRFSNLIAILQAKARKALTARAAE